METETQPKSRRAESDFCNIPGMVDSSYLPWIVCHNTPTRGLLRIPVPLTLPSPSGLLLVPFLSFLLNNPGRGKQPESS